MPDPDLIQVFHCPKAPSAVEKAWRFKRLDCTRISLVAAHNWIFRDDNVSSVTPSTASTSPFAGRLPEVLQR
jgi:hypothetical protein